MTLFKSAVSSQWSVASAGGRTLQLTDHQLLTTDSQQKR